jgi:hypothetical protein
MRPRALAFRLALFASASIPACGADEEPLDNAANDSTSDEEITPDEIDETNAPPILAAARCAAEAECQCEGYSTQDACTALWNFEYRNLIADAIATGWQFDAECAAEQIAAWRAPDCDASDDDPEAQRWWNRCMIVHGTADEGELCLSQPSAFGACDLGLACSGVWDEGVCVGPSEENGPCVSSDDCGSGLVCDGEVCRTPEGLGGACEDSSTCVGWARCVDGQCQSLESTPATTCNPLTN